MLGELESARIAARARLRGDRSTAVFRTLLAAIAAPAQPRRLPAHTTEPDLPEALLLPLALADLGSSFWIQSLSDERERKLATDVLRTATGAVLSGPDVAMFVVCLDGDPAVPSRVRAGSEHAPESAVKLAVQVDDLAAGTPVRVHGPGISEPFVTAVGLERSFLEALRSRNRPPVGIDTWVFDRRQQVLALPRSTRFSFDDEQLLAQAAL